MNLYKYISLYYNKDTWKFIAYVVAIFIIGISVLIPWYPDFIQTAAGDESYAYVYHEIFAGKSYCGNDLYCHHGPLGIWYWPIYHPDTFPIVIISHIYVAVVIVATISSIVFNQIKSYAIRFFYVLMIIGLLSVDLDARIFLVNMLLLTLLPRYFNKRESFLTILLLSVIAFSFYVKSTFIIFGFVSVVGASLIEITMYRRVPRVFLWYILFLIVFSFISGMSILSIPQHIVRTFDFARGYTDIFSEYGNYYEIIIFIVLALIFGFFVIKSRNDRPFLVRWLYIVCYATLTFLIYKASFTRLDGQHVLHGYVSIITTMALYTTANFSMIFNSNNAIYYRKFPLAIAPFLVTGVLIFLYNNPTIYQGKFQKLYINVSTAISIIFADSSLTDLHNSAKKKIVDEYPIKSIDGRVLLLDKRQTIGIANNLNLQFLPTIADVVAVNSEAELLNAESFTTDKAPEYLLVSEGIFPGKTILEIIKNYTFDSYNNDFLQLKKIPKGQIELIFGKDNRFNTDINKVIHVSNINDLLWVNIAVNKTVLGKFVEFFYKIPRLYIEIERIDGTKEAVYVSLDLLKNGFVLSYTGARMYDIFDKNSYDVDIPIKSFILKSTGGLMPFFDPIINVNIRTINIAHLGD